MISGQEKKNISERYAAIKPFLYNEQQRRIFAAAEARVIVYGGISILNRITGILKIQRCLQLKVFENGGIQWARKIIPKLQNYLLQLMEEEAIAPRTRLWKYELQKLSSEMNIDIIVCHYPPGTNKWNAVEHRMFSYISQNWRGRPLESHEVIINLIGSTTTKKGLHIECALDTNKYEKGIKIENKQMEQINIIRNNFHGDWNYTIKPALKS